MAFNLSRVFGQKAPAISVIVATWNCGKYLPAFIESLAIQTLKDFETIFIDDGSTDGTEQIIVQTGFPCRYQRLIRHKNQCVARNYGVSLARGEYLFFPDADSTLAVDCIERLYNALGRAKDAAYAYGDYDRTDKHTGHRTGQFRADNLRLNNFVSMASLWRKKDWIPLDEKIPGPMLEDWDQALTMLDKGKEGVYTGGGPLFMAHLRRQGVTISRRHQTMHAIQYIRAKHRNHPVRLQSR